MVQFGQVVMDPSPVLKFSHHGDEEWLTPTPSQRLFDRVFHHPPFRSVSL